MTKSYDKQLFLQALTAIKHPEGDTVNKQVRHEMGKIKTACDATMSRMKQSWI